MGGASLFMRVVSIVSSVVLMRLLDPADFGLVALAGVVLATTNLFSGLGMGLAVIQSQEDRRRLARQGFVVSGISGLLFFVTLQIAAPTIAIVLGKTEVVPVLRWLSVVVLLGALVGVPESILQKDLSFGRVSAAVVTADLFNLGCSIALALAGFGVWSLVWASLARSLLYLTLIWSFCPDRPWLSRGPWDGGLMKRMMSYGLQSTGSGLVSFLYSVIDNFLVGRNLGTEALGYYSKAYDFNTRTVDGFINVVGLVLFPSYAKMQDNPERLTKAYLKSLRLMSMFTIPVALGMFVVAQEAIPLVLGHKWDRMISPFQVFAFVSVIKPLSASTGALFAATGHPVYNLRAGLLIIVATVPTILLVLGQGIAAVAGAMLFGHILGLFYNMYQVNLLLPGRWFQMLAAVGPAFAGSAAMALVVEVVKNPILALGGGAVTVGGLVGIVCAGVIVYTAWVMLFQRPLVKELIDLALHRASSGAAGDVLQQP